MTFADCCCLSAGWTSFSLMPALAGYIPCAHQFPCQPCLGCTWAWEGEGHGFTLHNMSVLFLAAACQVDSFSLSGWVQVRAFQSYTFARRWSEVHRGSSWTLQESINPQSIMGATVRAILTQPIISCVTSCMLLKTRLNFSIFLFHVVHAGKYTLKKKIKRRQSKASKQTKNRQQKKKTPTKPKPNPSQHRALQKSIQEAEISVCKCGPSLLSVRLEN